MPRKRRRWSPGAVHHAVARGHSGCPLFATDEDRAFFVARAIRAFAETRAVCLAWSVLSNHYHVLATCNGPPGPTFARLDGAVARRERRLRGGRGPVFEDRYYSDPCADEDSLRARFAYVLGNPVHHKIVPTLDSLSAYRWSGLGEILGLRAARWIDVDAALSMFDSDPRRARDRLLDVMEKMAERWAAEDGAPVDDRASVEAQRLASRPVVEVVLPGEPPRDSAIERIVDAACALTGARRAAVRAGRHTPSEVAARSVAAFVACDVAGLPMVAVASNLGVYASALVQARKRGRAKLLALGVPPESITF
jgi:hypothetical protein